MDKLYTRTGDGGMTSAGGARLAKNSPLIDLIGTVDELSAALLWACAALSGAVLRDTRRLERICFAVMCELAGGGKIDADALPYELEQMCDRAGGGALSEFLTFTSEAATRLNLARTVARRAERCAVSAACEIRPEILRVLNRSSDAIFALARAADKGAL